MQRDLQYLHEMGISAWQIREPTLFPDYHANLISLPESCKLLLIAEKNPQQHEAWLFAKVLASMKLTPEQAVFLPVAALELLSEHQLTWCWFSGVQVTPLTGVRTLSSISLSEMRESSDSRRHLWQQICAYER
ncbi:DNA polymerase III subunit psi [Aliivibrio kagoshimensis]|uniref:DNA polymerase III subunit psi n=1 Tax=Aliivibrio kagoshimensis TaxID=2910230 RepID=UPI003D11B9C2